MASQVATELESLVGSLDDSPDGKTAALAVPPSLALACTQEVPWHERVVSLAHLVEPEGLRGVVMELRKGN